MAKYFSSNLKYLRESLGISKSDLAKKLNVNQSTISRWENDEMGINLSNAYDLAQYLNISLSDLVGINLKNTEIPPDSNNLQNKINTLNEEQQKAIINIIDNMNKN